MVFSAEALESEIRKLHGLLQMLHEDQPGVMEDVFEFHVGSLISHASPDQHGYIRTRAQEMIVAIRALPPHADGSRASFQLMQEPRAAA